MAAAAPALQKKMSRNPGRIGMIIFGIALVAGLIYSVTALTNDLGNVRNTSTYEFILLGVALFTALGFEFVNGFHDTANAVATVIYTHSMEPHVAVVWSGMWNFIGVLTSSGAVAFGIISLLPVELILQVGQRSRLCDGLCTADRGNPMEHRDLVSRTSGIELPHYGRLDYWRGHCQSAHVAEVGHQRG